MKNDQPITIFDSIQLDKDPKLINELLLEMNFEQAIFILVEAVKNAHKHGVYSLLESELISKSIRKIYEEKREEN
jgi:hypothetical protein